MKFRFADLLLGVVVLLSASALGKKMDKRFYKLVGKRHRFDYK